MATKVTLKIQAEDAYKKQYVNGTGSTIAARTLVQIAGSGLVGYIGTDLADGSTGTVITAGVVEIAKNTGVSGKDFKVGEAVFWDKANDRADKTGTADAVYLGTAFEAAGTTASTMLVAINDRPAINFARIVVSSGQALANSNNGQVDIVTGLGVAPKFVSHPTVIDASTGVLNTGYVLDLTTAAGTISIKGVGSGIQLDENDVLMVQWMP